MRLHLSSAGIGLEFGSARQTAGAVPTPDGGSRADGLTADQYSMAWLADSYVLGRYGIEPRLSTSALRLWRRHYVDVDAFLRPRDYQRVHLMAMITGRDAWEYDTEHEAGLRVMPPPTRIEISRSTGLPAQYVWRLPGTSMRRPLWLRCPASSARVYLLPTEPQQRRGADLYGLVREVAAEREALLPAVVQLARLTSIMRVFHKSDNLDPLIDAQYQPSVEPVEVDFSRSGITQIGRLDDIVTPNISPPPVRVDDVDRAASAAIGRVYGISRLSAGRDGADANFSYAQLADNTDRVAWQRYQDLIGTMLEIPYRRWRIAVMAAGIATEADLPIDPDWDYPVVPSANPHRQAQVHHQRIIDGVASPQMVIRELGYDPDVVMAEIDAWRAHYPEGVS